MWTRCSWRSFRKGAVPDRRPTPSSPRRSTAGDPAIAATRQRGAGEAPPGPNQRRKSWLGAAPGLLLGGRATSPGDSTCHVVHGLDQREERCGRCRRRFRPSPRAQSWSDFRCRPDWPVRPAKARDRPAALRREWRADSSWPAELDHAAPRRGRQSSGDGEQPFSCAARSSATGPSAMLRQRRTDAASPIVGRPLIDRSPA